jgi:dethiobiotin synthetase
MKSIKTSPKTYFISGIDTNIGKTVVSSILTEALEADYWKPIQAGDLDNSDTDKVKSLVRNSDTEFHPNAYALKTPASPHYAAELDQVRIDMNNIQIPQTQNHLIIEGAGGLLVPLNDKDLVIDLIVKLKVPLILVMKNYLGSINHSLMSIEVAKQRGISIRGLIFNGETNSASEDYILQYSDLPILGRIKNIEELNSSIIKQYAKQFEFLKYD